MRLSAAHIVGLVLLTGVVVAGFSATACAAPPKFGVEVEAGTAAGLTSYLRNEVVTTVDRSQTDDQGRFLLRPSLADVTTGTGTSVALRLIASNIAAGLSVSWFDLTANEIHHRGDRSLPITRVRPDGSVDDSGVGYQQISPALDQTIPTNSRNTLLVFGLGGDYRFFWPGKAFDVFVPVGAQLVITHVTRTAGPYRLGLAASSGLGMTIQFLDGVALVVDARLHALATGHYGRRADAARRAVSVGESTEDAFFSTLAFASANVALQFTIR